MGILIRIFKNFPINFEKNVLSSGQKHLYDKDEDDEEYREEEKE